MGRGKFTMELIKKQQTRSTTYTKRKKGLIKKALELSTLCGIDTCMIIYGPTSKDENTPIQVWPENRNEVNRIINRYKEKLELRGGKTFSLLDFYLRRKKKVDDDISKLQKSNMKAKYPRWDPRLDNFSFDQMKSLISQLDAKLDDLKSMMTLIKGEDSNFLHGNNFNVGQDYDHAMIPYDPNLLFKNNMQLDVANYNNTYNQDLQPLSSLQDHNYYNALQNVVPSDHHLNRHAMNNNMMMSMSMSMARGNNVNNFGYNDFNSYFGQSSREGIPYIDLSKVNPLCYDSTMCFNGQPEELQPIYNDEYSMMLPERYASFAGTPNQ